MCSTGMIIDGWNEQRRLGSTQQAALAALERTKDIYGDVNEQLDIVMVKLELWRLVEWNW